MKKLFVLWLVLVGPGATVFAAEPPAKWTSLFHATNLAGRVVMPDGTFSVSKGAVQVGGGLAANEWPERVRPKKTVTLRPQFP